MRRGVVPPAWLEDIEPEEQPLFEQFLLGVAQLPDQVVDRLDEVIKDPTKDDFDVMRLLFWHHFEAGGNGDALAAWVKLVTRRLERDGSLTKLLEAVDRRWRTVLN